MGTVSFHWTSSFSATNLGTSSHPKEYTTLLHGRKGEGFCQTCSTLIGIGRVYTSSFKGRIRYAVQKSGL